MARPTKLTPDTIKKLRDALQLGASYELASKYAGITYQTFNEWIKEGQSQRSGPKREFFETMSEAEGKGAVGWLAKIEAAANDGAWQAAAWKLERRYPHEYGRTVQEHTGRNGGPIEITAQTRDASAEELAAWRKQQIDALADTVLSGQTPSVTPPTSPASTATSTSPRETA